MLYPVGPGSKLTHKTRLLDLLCSRPPAFCGRNLSCCFCLIKTGSTMADADLMSIGQQCTVCRCCDFLPYCCPACRDVFCQEHRHRDAHKCTGHAEATAIVCPLCALAIKLRPDEDPNAAFEAHMRAQARLPALSA